MVEQGLFIHGAGEGAFAEDGLMVNSLTELLADQIAIHYDPMPDEGNPTYRTWKEAIDALIRKTPGNLLLVGHSFGGSVLLKYLSEQPIDRINALFLIAAPFWNEDKEWTLADLLLPDDLADRLAYIKHIYFYHAQDDDIVPLSHLRTYQERLPQASYHVLERGGHQLNNDLRVVARAIQPLLND